MKTRKGAASIYIVIFTTTLLGIIALSFVRIMLAESLRTTNYSLSQSAYNSALAGIEDAKIVLLRYQSCINNNSFKSGGGKTGNCDAYKTLFSDINAAYKTSQDCNAVGKLLHPSQKNNGEETLIQTRDSYDTGTIDQAYTCVKIAAYTEDFLASLNAKNPTKLIPLRSDSQEMQNAINRIQVQWFDDQNYHDVTDGDGVLKSGYSGFWKSGNISDFKGTKISNKGDYDNKTAAENGNIFVGNGKIIPPAIQVTMIQTTGTFTMDQFYASGGIDNNSPTNRGTLLLRPTTNKSIKASRMIDDTTAGGNHSNVLPQNSLAYSANKSFNTPMDVICDPGNSAWGTYACSADFFLPKPMGGNTRNMSTSFLVVNLPYGGPQTDISVKMYSCQDPSLPINAVVGSSSEPNCSIVYFANVQPMVDSTGRANDLFRRVESRIELVDTNFPIANYALAMTDPSNSTGIVKDFYVTKNCSYSSTEFDSTTGKVTDGGAASHTCKNAMKNSASSSTPGKGNGE